MLDEELVYLEQGMRPVVWNRMSLDTIFGIWLRERIYNARAQAQDLLSEIR